MGMSVLPYFFGLLALAAAFYWLHIFWRKRTRNRILATKLTSEQRMALDRLVPMMNRMPADLQERLEGKINLFLDQVTFRGIDGLQITEAMRLSIAAQACLLIVNSSLWFESLRTILVYPSAFRTRRSSHDGYVVHDDDNVTLGESWDYGPVVLAWDHALQGGLDDGDGHNVVIHEFAHQLDSLTGHTNGIPILRKGQDYKGWEEAMLEAFHAHVERVERGHPSLIDPYGATNHQEFFAEAVVTFYERPQALRREEPALYAQLSELLALDPAQWH